ncbi:MAG: hypothetical protein PHV17_01950 [Candidatus Omnitrophica bacterium]|nr:hypothetical protein [Candidatus Omnitrophota bacterium]
MRKLYIPIIAVFCVIIAGCASVHSFADISITDERNLAQKLIEDDFSAFSQFSKQFFSQRVSESFIPDKASFLNELENSFFTALPIDMSFSLDKVLVKGNKLAATFTWQKKVSLRVSNDLILKEGMGEMVYIKENNKWLIYQVREDSLFTF